MGNTSTLTKIFAFAGVCFIAAPLFAYGLSHGFGVAASGFGNSVATTAVGVGNGLVDGAQWIGAQF